MLEASNETRGESYLAATHFAPDEAFAALAKRLPSRLSHWRRHKDRIQFRTLGFNLSREEALRFIADYARKRAGERKYLAESRTLLFKHDPVEESR